MFESSRLRLCVYFNPRKGLKFYTANKKNHVSKNYNNFVGKTEYTSEL